jgi:aspartate aminotransferase
LTAAVSTVRRAQRIAAIEVSEILRIGALAEQRRREGRPVIVPARGGCC